MAPPDLGGLWDSNPTIRRKANLNEQQLNNLTVSKYFLLVVRSTRILLSSASFSIKTACRVTRRQRPMWWSPRPEKVGRSICRVDTDPEWKNCRPFCYVCENDREEHATMARHHRSNRGQSSWVDYIRREGINECRKQRERADAEENNNNNPKEGCWFGEEWSSGSRRVDTTQIIRPQTVVTFFQDSPAATFHQKALDDIQTTRLVRTLRNNRCVLDFQGNRESYVSPVWCVWFTLLEV